MGYVEFYVKITFILTLSVKSFISHTAYSCVAYDEEKKWSEDHDQG